MKQALKYIACVPLLAVLAGCGGEKPAPAAAEVEDEVVTSLTITGDDRMRFNITSFTVPAGAHITLTFHNMGTMAKEVMGHNLAVLDRSMDPNVFAAAAIRHPTNRYIPPEYEDKVIAATDVLGPDEQETLHFTAPTTPGDYPFVCSFPGHTPAGMKGIMTVK